MKKVYLFLINILLIANVFAQVGATNNGALQINSGATMTVIGAFTNNASGSFTNNGNLYVQGNLTNNQASISAGSGTLFLNGTGAQIVSGTQPMRTNHLNTDNTNTNGITLNNNLHVSGTHIFTNGIITTSSTPNYLVYEAGSGYAGSTNARHVNGWVKKIGNTNFTFPVGNGSLLREIAIGALTMSSEFNARYVGTTPNTSNLLSPLVHINPAEHWELNKISGGNAQATLNWDQSKVSFPNYVLADIRSAQYSGGNWASTGGSATGTIATTGSITSNSMGSFGLLSIGSVSYVLPLQIIGVSANRVQDYTSVQWKTVNEERVALHEVQRSLSPSNFISIGQVTARNLQQIQTYDFNDHEVLIGTIYYRIKSIDIDGKVSYSKIVSIQVGSSASLRLLQNPVRETILLSTNNKQAAKYFYQLIATDGTLGQQGTISYTGLGIISIPVKPSVAKGTYLLQVQDLSNTHTLKVVVE